MEDESDSNGGVGGPGSDQNGGECELFSDSAEDESRGSNSSSETSCSEEPQGPVGSQASPEQSATSAWKTLKNPVFDSEAENDKTHQKDREVEKPKPSVSETEMMMERFSKLLLGEDMSGSGKGVCTALAISNAITNLCATVFGQLWRLEPLAVEKKSMWQREMKWLLCVSDHIVEMIPSWQTFPDGSRLEVMTCRPRTDLYVNLPALQKLDNMLLEILDNFIDTEFWYVDQGILTPEFDGSASFRRTFHQREEKWWLPIPCVPPGGLSEVTKKQLQHKRDCTNQILKAALAINSNALAEMDIPDSYIDSLPKNARASLGDAIHRGIISDQYDPESLLDSIDLSSEYQALEIANRVEASIYLYRRRAVAKLTNGTSRSNTKSSWGMVMDMLVDTEKRELLADRAESLLLCLKQRFPSLTQTTLDMSKIQFNKDVGKSILESYSRVLESLAFNVIARIDDLLYVDDLSKLSDHYLSVPTISVSACKEIPIPYSVPVSGTPYATAYATPSFSPAPLHSTAKGEKSSFVERKPHYRGLSVKKVLTDYLGDKGRSSRNLLEISERMSSMNVEVPAATRILDDKTWMEV